MKPFVWIRYIYKDRMAQTWVMGDLPPEIWTVFNDMMDPVYDKVWTDVRGRVQSEINPNERTLPWVT